MSDPYGKRNRLTTSQASHIQQRRAFIAALPDGRFHCSLAGCECPAIDAPYYDAQAGTLDTLHDAGILKKVDRHRYHGTIINIWRVPRQVKTRAEELVATIETPIPGCPHRGVRNLPDGGYTCLEADCDVEVSRSEVRL